MATTTTLTPTTTPAVNGVTTPAVPTQLDAQANWDANLQQAMQYYQAQVKMDRDQQAIAFSSNVEAKAQQMMMACIQNIR